MKTFLFSISIVLFVLPNFAIETAQAAVANLEPASGYYWEWGQSGWTGSSLSPSEISSICDNDPQSGFHAQSSTRIWPSGSHELWSPCVIICFDARPLVNWDVTITARAEHLVTPLFSCPSVDMCYLMPGATDPWDRSQYFHFGWWDTSSNPQVTFGRSVSSLLSPEGFLYLCVDGGQVVAGGSDPSVIDMVDVYTLTVTGEVVPEPATLLLLSFGSLALLRKHRA